MADPSTKYIASRMWRIMGNVIAEEMGENTRKTMVRRAHLDRYIDSLPPNDDSPSISHADYARVSAVILDLFGERGAKAILARAGHVATQEILKSSPVMTALAGIAFKILPENQRLKIAFERLVSEGGTLLGISARMTEERDAFIVEIPDSPFCEGQQTDHPVCYGVVGSYEELSKWATGKKHKVEETQCRAMGAATCLFRIDKAAMP